MGWHGLDGGGAPVLEPGDLQEDVLHRFYMRSPVFRQQSPERHTRVCILLQIHWQHHQVLENLRLPSNRLPSEPEPGKSRRP